VKTIVSGKNFQDPLATLPVKKSLIELVQKKFIFLFFPQNNGPRGTLDFFVEAENVGVHNDITNE